MAFVPRPSDQKRFYACQFVLPWPTALVSIFAPAVEGVRG
jgi:hypothetical protein